jgi:L-lysine 6-transaminase
MFENKVSTSVAKFLINDRVSIYLDLERSHGQYLVDATTGKSYLDCAAFYSSNPIGFNHPSLVDSVFTDTMSRIGIVKPSNSDFFTPEFSRFVDTFVKIALPKEFQHLFFISGGTLAVENALKVAFDWKVRKNIAKGLDKETGTKVIHFQQAFHGRSGYTLSLTNTADSRKTKYFPKFEWPRILNPKLTFPVTPESIIKVLQNEQLALDQIQQAFNDHGDDIACIIIEPIQGEGGDNHFRPEFLHKLRAIADENDVLLIFDEIQTGVGATGLMWCFQHFGITPDILVFGKKMQVCGIAATGRVDEVESNVFRESSRINSTWGGSLIDMVRCRKYLEIIDSENLVDNADKVGTYLTENLKLLAESTSKINNVRGRGLIVAFDCQDSLARDTLKAKLFDKGVYLLQSGINSIRFRPSLNFSFHHVDEVISKLKQCLL